MWASAYSSGSRTSITSAPPASASANVSTSTSGASGCCSAPLMVTVLGRQHLGMPMRIAGSAAIAEPVVQAVGPAAPELDGVGRDEVPAPVRRPRDVGHPGEAGLDQRHLPVEIGPPTGTDLALGRRPRADPAA